MTGGQRPVLGPEAVDHDLEPGAEHGRGQHQNHTGTGVDHLGHEPLCLTTPLRREGRRVDVGYLTAVGTDPLLGGVRRVVADEEHDHDIGVEPVQ